MKMHARNISLMSARARALAMSILGEARVVCCAME
jgi:hypothetical protein